jgi:hypothetical protein
MGIYEDREMLKQYEKEHPEDFLWGVSKFELYYECLKDIEFPGTLKYDKSHPIWDCNVGGKKTPKQAWYDEDLMFKAIDNLYYIMHKLMASGKEQDFVQRVYNAFNAYYGVDYDKRDSSALAKEILNRFTIAKIAPKVGAIQPSYVRRIIEDSGIDLSSGIYVPMAGFGGIVEASKQWFKKHNLEPNIETYDINPNFCKYFGWTKRDVLAQKIKTDKVVICCPPFSTLEMWEGTPNNMYYDFHTWCKLIKEHIDAKNYILIGPEQTDLSKSKYKSGAKTSGLFRKKTGVQWYKEYSL